MKTRSTIIVGSILTLSVFFSGYLLHSPAAPKAEASTPAEATALATSIAKDISDFKHGQDLVDQGNDLMQRSSLSARGKDLQLCADYNLVYSRTTKKLESNPDCAKATVTTDTPSFQ